MSLKAAIPKSLPLPYRLNGPHKGGNWDDKRTWHVAPTLWFTLSLRSRDRLLASLYNQVVRLLTRLLRPVEEWIVNNPGGSKYPYIRYLGPNVLMWIRKYMIFKYLDPMGMLFRVSI